MIFCRIETALSIDGEVGVLLGFLAIIPHGSVKKRRAAK
jgi:hypothetical protein